MHNSRHLNPVYKGTLSPQNDQRRKPIQLNAAHYSERHFLIIAILFVAQGLWFTTTCAQLRPAMFLCPNNALARWQRIWLGGHSVNRLNPFSCIIQNKQSVKGLLVYGGISHLFSLITLWVISTDLIIIWKCNNYVLHCGPWHVGLHRHVWCDLTILDNPHRNLKGWPANHQQSNSTYQIWLTSVWVWPLASV